jgi:hypothetical protein
MIDHIAVVISLFDHFYISKIEWISGTEKGVINREMVNLIFRSCVDRRNFFVHDRLRVIICQFLIVIFIVFVIVLIVVSDDIASWTDLPDELTIPSEKVGFGVNLPPDGRQTRTQQMFPFGMRLHWRTKW